MTRGTILTLWTIRAAAVLYALSVISWLRRGDRIARLTWTIACFLCLVHVGFAFNSYHHWSQAAAYDDTSRRTAQLLGAGWGGGLYFNYLFTIA